MNYALGGRLFPGEHHRAQFRVRDDEAGLSFEMLTDDGSADVALHGQSAEQLQRGSCFGSLEAASRFFKDGSVGYSRSRDGNRLEGLRFRIVAWQMACLDLSALRASFYEDTSRFPSGSIEYDSTFIMRDLAHEWEPAH